MVVNRGVDFVIIKFQIGGPVDIGVYVDYYITYWYIITDTLYVYCMVLHTIIGHVGFALWSFLVYPAILQYLIFLTDLQFHIFWNGF